MEKRLSYDYHYGQESKQYSFFKIPKVLMEDSRFEEMSLTSRFLYGIMLDRMELSQKNGWLDGKNRVYIYFSIEEVMQHLKCGKEKAVRLLSELDNDFGLIERKRQGQGKPSIIYVKHFARFTDEPAHDCAIKENEEVGNRNFLTSEKQTSRSTDNPAELPEVRKRNFKKSDNRTSGGMDTELQEVRKTNRNDNNINKTKLSDTKSIIPTHQTYGGGMDAADSIDRLRGEIHERIEYETLSLQFRRDELDNIVEIMLEIALSSGGAMRIGDRTLNIEYVKKRFESLGQFHIEYVMSCMAETKADVRNIKSYLVSALFNAPATIELYYSAKVNHDFAGG